MPRSHGRIMSAIWSDPDFIAMRGSAQRMFMFLLSQPDLSHAGLIPMRVRRWATKAGDLNPKQVRDELDYLAERDFIVTDESTEEVLIRTMVRNDGVYKQPKVMLRMREDAQQIESPLLRAAFRGELERLPLDELSTEPTGRNSDGPSTRESVESVVDTLRSDFADTPEYPSEWVSDTPPDTPRVRAGALPLPPSPVPQKDTSASATAERERESEFAEFWKLYPRKKDKGHAVKAYRTARKKASAEAILTGLRAQLPLLQQSEERFRPYAATWLNGERWTDETNQSAPANDNPWDHFVPPPCPAEVADDPAEYDRWMREKRAEWDAQRAGGDR